MNAYRFFRVTREIRKPGTTTEWGPAELFCIAPPHHLEEILRLRHREAMIRVMRELTTEPIAFIYDGNTRYAIEIAREIV